MNKVCLAVVVLCLVQALAFRVRVGRPSRPSFTLKMSDAAEDFSKYAVGQEVKGKVVSSKAFGVFVELEGTKTRALLPRSLLSRGAYEKLTLLATTKSSETIACELASVSAENKTLSATWGAPTMDVTTILKEDYKTKKFPATVVGTHDFGVFVELDGYGVDGLIPSSFLGLGRGGNPKGMYKNGQAVEVTINEMSEDGKKMTLALDGAAAGTGPAGGDSGSGSLEGSGFTAGKWLQGEVQSVSSFGLFVRPAGTEVTGLIHMSQIPRDLISALKKRSSAQPSGNQTDVEMLFQKGDVVSCRINSYGGPKKIDMSMLPPKNEEDDDDYVVDGRDPEEAEPKEGPDGQQRRPRGEVKTGGIDSESIEVFNGEKKLLWWKGESYVPTPEFALSEDQQENEITKESKSLVEGTWRRMFELDLRKDEAEFSSKVNDKELKELQEDIGELMGLDDDMFAEPETLSLSISRPKVGTFQVGSLDGLPDDWRKEMEFFKELEGAETTTMAMMRAGKASDQSEFDGVVRTVEVDIQSKSPRREAPAPAPVVTVEEVPVETPVAEAPTEETAAPESASADA